MHPLGNMAFPSISLTASFPLVPVICLRTCQLSSHMSYLVELPCPLSFSISMKECLCRVHLWQCKVGTGGSDLWRLASSSRSIGHHAMTVSAHAARRTAVFTVHAAWHTALSTAAMQAWVWHLCCTPRAWALPGIHAGMDGMQAQSTPTMRSPPSKPKVRALRAKGASMEQAGGLQRMTLRGHRAGLEKVLLSPSGIDVITGGALDQQALVNSIDPIVMGWHGSLGCQIGPLPSPSPSCWAIFKACLAAFSISLAR